MQTVNIAFQLNSESYESLYSLSEGYFLMRLDKL